MKSITPRLESHSAMNTINGGDNISSHIITSEEPTDKPPTSKTMHATPTQSIQKTRSEQDFENA